MTDDGRLSAWLAVGKDGNLTDMVDVPWADMTAEMNADRQHDYRLVFVANRGTVPMRATEVSFVAVIDGTLVAMAADPVGAVPVEKTGRSDSTDPSKLVFSSGVDGETVRLGTIEPGGAAGLWIRRTGPNRPLERMGYRLGVRAL